MVLAGVGCIHLWSLLRAVTNVALIICYYFQQHCCLNITGNSEHCIALSMAEGGPDESSFTQRSQRPREDWRPDTRSTSCRLQHPPPLAARLRECLGSGY
ncbi:hypothetical protein E2C01_004184 [Portunus trituberculatus]|uniref:Secreted protein n=1 Tax=Portunus trituberculatus TaxID=210409 RepID=A0A5B7CP74_PORTR|nr:hypothetical protein [Portunus trituberculatus]